MSTKRYGKNWDPVQHYQNAEVARAYDGERFSSLAGRVFNFLDRRAMRRALADLPAGAALGDMPCGTGRIAEVALAMGFTVHGVDVSGDMIAVARQRLARFGSRFTAEERDILRVDAAPRHDAVISARFLMHFPPAEQRELVRVIAGTAKGRVIIGHGVEHPFHRLRRALKSWTGWFQNPASFPISEAQLADILHYAGLREIRRHAVLPWVTQAVVIVAEPRAEGGAMIQKYLAPDAGGGRAPRKLRILTFTTLYPNAAQPTHGVFVENRLRQLLDSGDVAARVVAPVPWFPSSSPVFGRYARFAAVPAEERRRNITVIHPRYAVLPKLGMSVSPWLLYRAALPTLKRLVAKQDFDIIDAHYFYPDGVAAIMLGRALGKPVVITARGTDVNLIPRHALPRRWIAWAAAQAAGIITVADALQAPLIALGVPPARIRTLRNGVDLDLFKPQERKPARALLGLKRRTLLSVGHLIERKGHHLVIEAMVRLADYELLIAGEGPERGRLEELARRLGVADRVRFLGARPHSALPKLYSAADALVLASSREGWANVLLESMACGTPAIASDAWGNPEVVAKPAAGVLMHENSAAGIADAAERLFDDPPARSATRRYAEKFSWDETTQGQLTLFADILGDTVSRKEKVR